MINLSVQNVTTNAGFVGGTVALQRQLSATSTFSLLSGSNAAVALGSGDSVTLSAALAIGETVTALVVETDGSGASFRQIAYALNITGAISTTDVYHLVMVRGAHTKRNAGAVNMGRLLFARGFIDTPFTADATQFTPRAGTPNHFGLPTNGASPSPNGNASQLGAADYVYDFTASGGGRTVSGTLTIKPDLGRSLPAYTFDRGARTLPAETFTAKSFSVSSTTELQALSAAESAGATVLLSLGCDPSFQVYPAYERHLPTPCLLQSEDLNRPTTVGRITANHSSGYYHDSLIVQASLTDLQTWYGSNATAIVSILGGNDRLRISRCTIGAPEGTANTDLPACSYGPGGSIDVFENTFDRITGNAIRSCTNSSFVRNTVIRWNADSLFLGNANNVVIDGLIVEGNWMGECVLATFNVHPDSGQLGTTLNPPVIIRGYYKMLDNTTWGGASDMSFNGPHYTGNGDYGVTTPIFECTPEVSGNFHGSLTLYGIGCANNATYQAGGVLYANTSVRQLTGVTGDARLGKASGAQGFDSFADDGVTPGPFQQRFPGGVDYKPGANVTIAFSYCDGRPFGGAVDFSQSYAKNKPQARANPVGLTPAQINDNSALFDDPNRVVPDWSIYTAAQKSEILREMYATKAGGPLDKGDGRVIGTWCVRRNGAPAKRNQYGTATLVASAASGQVTATLSRVLGVDVICDVVRNGVATGVAITIPAGQTAASAAATFTAGDTILLKNDCGLLNPSAIAA